MSKRKTISKKTRFEVFKRDSFTCQYCGESAPKVLLELDHIMPIAKGGTDEILNLITSCNPCNNGKRANLLSDDSVITKQRNQLEYLEERRQQMELLFEWKKSLSALDDETNEHVFSYINRNIEPYQLSEKSRQSMVKLLKKYGLEALLKSVDLAAEKYIRFDDEGQVTQDSANAYSTKIGGILVNEGKSDVEKKMSYIKGICRNRFNYWNVEQGSKLLQEYVNALRDQKYSEDQVYRDLENELQPRTIDCRNWSQWRQLLEKWIDEVNNWNNDKSTVNLENIDVDKIDHDYMLDIYVDDKLYLEEAFGYIGTAFEGYSKDLIGDAIDECVLRYLEASLETEPNYELMLEWNTPVMQYFRAIDPLTEGLRRVVEQSLSDYLKKICIAENPSTETLARCLKIYKVFANQKHQEVVDS